ncbi:MAG: GDSL-type esterase/lipase family protein [Rufibacter sp.]
MNKTISCLPFWIIAIIFCGCTSSGSTASPEMQELPVTTLHPLGRYQINSQQHLELISSAAHAGFSFEGREVVVVAGAAWEKGHTYLQYELDGVYQRRVRINGLLDTVKIVSPTLGKHAVWLYKTTEAHSGALVLHQIKGKNLSPLKKAEAPLIEFIGNSITCGAAADPSEIACGTGDYHDQHNAYLAYGPRVARALHANFILSSVSGIGVYRNWNSSGPTMPQVYEKLDFQPDTEQNWDFQRVIPALVSIALGTNDFSRGDGKTPRLAFDSAQFVKEYVRFVKEVKRKYPKATIALLSSPMLQGQAKQILENCLSSVKNQVDKAFPGQKPIAVHFFKPMQARGCTGHPNVEDHQILAQELTPFFKELLRL